MEYDFLIKELENVGLTAGFNYFINDEEKQLLICLCDPSFIQNHFTYKWELLDTGYVKTDNSEWRIENFRGTLLPIFLRNHQDYEMHLIKIY